MTDTKRRNSIAVFAALLLIYSVAFFGSRLENSLPDLFVLAATLDLTITVPVLVYLFFIRKKRSVTTIFPIVLASFGIAALILPDMHHTYLNQMIVGLFAIEAIFACLLLYKLILVVNYYATSTAREDLFLNRLQTALIAVMGDMTPARILLSEISMYAYLFSLKASLPELGRENSFSYHEKSGYLGIMIMLIHTLLFEGIGMHFLLMQWSPAIAWIGAVLNLYSMLYMIADYKATKRTPILVGESEVTVQIGFRKKLVIPLHSIRAISENAAAYQQDRKRNDIFLGTALLSLEEPKVLIELHEAIEQQPSLGRAKRISKVYVSVDEPKRFIAYVSARINER